MEVVRKELTVSCGDTMNIYFIGDIHEGNVNHAEPEFRKAINIIKDDPCGYWVGMGDYIEAITVDDKKRFSPLSIAKKYGIEDLKDLPYKQMEAVFKKIEPIQNKCLCLLTGNHEDTYMKHNSSNVYYRFVEMFDNPPPKMGYVGFLKLCLKSKAGKNLYSPLFALNHGDGGGGFREGYPLNKLWDVFRWVDADVSVMGHVHRLMEDDKKFLSVSQADVLTKKRRYVGISGCFLWTYQDGHVNYFEHKGRNESDIGMLMCSMNISDRSPNIALHKIKLG